MNREVNREIKQVSDRELYGTVEHWALPDRGRGDCEDLALEKMRRLLDRGVPADRLFIAIGLDTRGNNHAVLLLRVSKEYLVLDSLTDRIIGLAEVSYRMLALQASEDRKQWKIANPAATAQNAASKPVLSNPSAETRIEIRQTANYR